MNLDKGGNWDGVQGISGDDVVMGCCCSNIRLGTRIGVGKEGWVDGKGADGGGGGAVVCAVCTWRSRRKESDRRCSWNQGVYIFGTATDGRTGSY